VFPANGEACDGAHADALREEGLASIETRLGGDESAKLPFGKSSDVLSDDACRGSSGQTAKCSSQSSAVSWELEASDDERMVVVPKYVSLDADEPLPAHTLDFILKIGTSSCSSGFISISCSTCCSSCFTCFCDSKIHCNSGSLFVLSGGLGQESPSGSP